MPTHHSADQDFDINIFNEAEQENGNPQTKGQPLLKFVVGISL